MCVCVRARVCVCVRSIVFIDEIDKIVEGTGMSRVTGGNVSSDGVQRDLLPIIEGTA